MPKGCKQPTKLFKNAVLRYLNAHPELVSEIAKARVDEARFASSQENPKGLAAFQVLHDMLDGPIVKEVKTTGEATTTVEVVRRDPKAKEAGEDG
jgi:trans-aconitate methyltransferase